MGPDSQIPHSDGGAGVFRLLALASESLEVAAHKRPGRQFFFQPRMSLRHAGAGVNDLAILSNTLSQRAPR
jgi:hypothetical protein